MIIAILVVLGLCVGSFVNAFVWRIHKQLNSKQKKKDKKFSIINGRSMCPHCHHELAAFDLIPVFSWLFLRGKCRYCHKPISWQYPVVEMLVAALFVASYIFWPGGEQPFAYLQSSVNFVTWLVMLTGFVALAVYDLKWMLLPNRIIYPLLLIALVLAVYNIIATGTMEALYQTLISVTIAGGLFFVLFQASAGRWIGGGDVKLGALIGLLLADAYLAFLMLLTASVTGTILLLPGLLLGKVKTTSRIPFGPFLIVAAIFVYLFGATIVDWYERQLGIDL